MTASAPAFGVSASDPFGIADASLVLSELQQSTAYTTAIANAGDGEFIPGSQKGLINGQTSLSATYRSATVGTIPARSLTAGGASPSALTGLSISTQAGQHATVSASGHAHVAGTGTNHNARLRAIELPAFDGFGASDFGLGIGVTPAYLQSGTFTVEIGHTDEVDKDGNFLCGTSHSCKYTAEFEAVDDSVAWTCPSGWVIAASDAPGAGRQSSSTHPRRTFRIEKHEGLVSPAAS
ncbi:MAG: hypothetical protein IJS32_08560 [Kiritimatiellae bacterium]|nr:hypothetical protein [Kiritimatiellia bacterium]